MRFIYIQKRKNIWWLGGMGVILRMSSGTVSPTLICRVKHEGYVWIGLKTQRLRLAFFFFPFFLSFLHTFVRLVAIVYILCKVGLFFLFSTHQCTLCTVYGPTNFTFQQLFY